MKKIGLSVFAFALLSTAGLIANAENVTLHCGESYTAGQGSCDGTISLECNQSYATVRFNLRACHWYKAKGDSGYGPLRSSYDTRINDRPVMKVTADPNGQSGIVLTLDTAYSSGPLPPPDSGPLPPPGPLPPQEPWYSDFDQPRAYYQSNVFASNSRWVPLTKPVDGGCGGFVAMFPGHRLDFQTVSQCSIGDVYDTAGNLLERRAFVLHRGVWGITGNTTDLYSRFGYREKVIVKLHSASYEHGVKIQVFLTK